MAEECSKFRSIPSVRNVSWECAEHFDHTFRKANWWVVGRDALRQVRANTSTMFTMRMCEPEDAERIFTQLPRNKHETFHCQNYLSFSLSAAYRIACLRQDIDRAASGQRQYARSNPDIFETV